MHTKTKTNTEVLSGIILATQHVDFSARARTYRVVLGEYKVLFLMKSWTIVSMSSDCIYSKT